MTNGRDESSDDEGRDRKVVQAYRAASDVLDEHAAPATRAAILAAAARAVDARPRDADEPFVPMPEELRVAAARRVAAAPMAAAAASSMSAKEWAEAPAPLQEVASARDTAAAAPARKPAPAAARRPLALAASFVVGGVALVVAFNVQRDPSFDEKPSSPLATTAVPAAKEAPSAGAAAPLVDTDKREAPVAAPSSVVSAQVESAIATKEPQRARVAAPQPEADAARRDGGAAENKVRQQAKKLAESADARVPEGDAPRLAAQAERAPARNEAPAPASRALVLDAPAASPVAPPPAAVAPPPAKADAQAGAAAASPPAFPASPASPAASAAPEPSAARDAIRAKEALSKPAVEEQRTSRLTGPASAASDAVGRVHAQPAPPPLMRARPVERTVPVGAAERAFEADPVRWIERVLTLRAAGSDDEADRELALLRERYPLFVVPAAALRRAGTR